MVKEIATIVEKQINVPVNFRNALEVENLYRFISDNNLRREAQMVFKYVHSCLVVKKSKKRGRKKKQLQ